MDASTVADTVQNSSNPFYTALGVLFIAGIIYLIVRKKKKKRSAGSGKKAKEVKRDSMPLKRVDDSTLMSIAQFQKVVYNRFVVFDLETTGLSPQNDRIIEIAAVRVENGRITDRFQRLVDPGVHITESASKVNHITDDMVHGYAKINQILPHFLKFVGRDVLVAHNASFDASFLRMACAECRLDPPKNFFDSMRLTVYWPDLKSKSLDSFLKAAGIENDQAHRALGDAEATAKLVIKSFDKIK